MTDLDRLFSELRKLNKPVPKPISLPTEEDVAAIELSTSVSFPNDFKRYLLTASDVVFGYMEPVTLTNPDGHTYFPEVLELARAYGVPDHLLPICHDNGNFYCVDKIGKVEIWDRNGSTDEYWDNIATWIEQVWIGESEP